MSGVDHGVWPNSNCFRVLRNRPPDRLRGGAQTDHLIALIHGTKDVTGIQAGSTGPRVNQYLDPGRHGDTEGSVLK
jgi:hypothetical protein